MTDDAQTPKRPAHLTPHNAAAFQIEGVVDRYHLRTPYTPELAPFLLGLMRPARGRVLELGCGTGEIARMLAPHVERIDAIDISAPMLARARTMSAGDHPAIRWIEAAAEQTPLEGPYALAVAGDALHWMQWEVVLPRVAAALSPGAYLAIVTAASLEPPWHRELSVVIPRYSTMRDFEPFVLVDELERRGLFSPTGETTLPSVPFTRTIDENIDAIHATAGLAAERMPPDDLRAFDAAARALLAPHVRDGVLTLRATPKITWGTAIRR